MRSYTAESLTTPIFGLIPPGSGSVPPLSLRHPDLTSGATSQSHTRRLRVTYTPSRLSTVHPLVLAPEFPSKTNYISKTTLYSDLFMCQKIRLFLSKIVYDRPRVSSGPPRVFRTTVGGSPFRWRRLAHATPVPRLHPRLPYGRTPREKRVPSHSVVDLSPTTSPSDPPFSSLSSSGKTSVLRFQVRFRLTRTLGHNSRRNSSHQDLNFPLGRRKYSPREATPIPSLSHSPVTSVLPCITA